MNREKGVAYCGLACCVCGENENCAGCRNEGCVNKDWCKNRSCCIDKGIKGCWECSAFPCGEGLLNNIRPLTFSKFIAEFGEETLLSCLEANEKAGLIYHYENQLIGDYDKPGTEDGIIHMLLHGKED
jgi:hypothetical protein